MAEAKLDADISAWFAQCEVSTPSFPSLFLPSPRLPYRFSHLCRSLFLNIFEFICSFSIPFSPFFVSSRPFLSSSTVKLFASLLFHFFSLSHHRFLFVDIIAFV